MRALELLQVEFITMNKDIFAVQHGHAGQRCQQERQQDCRYLWRMHRI